MSIKTIYDLVNHSVEKFADRIAYTMFERTEVTYAQVKEEIQKVQEELINSGLNPGDKVAILSTNMPNWGICYFSIVTAGMVAVPILPDFSSDELAMIITHSEAKALFVSDKLYSKLSKPTLNSLNVVIRTKNLAVIDRNCSDKGSIAIPSEDDLAVIIYTSGTTSKPKGVMLSHYNLISQVHLLQVLFPIYCEDSFLSILPLSHTFECSLGMLFPFRYGAQVTYLDRPPTASTLLPALKHIRPTIMLIVPLIIEKIFKSQVQAKFTSNTFWRTICKPRFMRNYLYGVAGRKLHKVFGEKLRFLGIGGAKLHPDTEEFLSISKFPYAIGYGLTETAPVIAGATPYKTRMGSTGPAMKGVEIRLDNINQSTGEGEIVTNTPCVMRGYYKNEEATREVFTEDGWFRTGDLGVIEPDGYIHIKGRLKNMILGPSGENIYPEEIESVLNSHHFIADSIVTEEQGRLVALVHFDTEKLEAQFEQFKYEFQSGWESHMTEWEERKDKMMKEIQEYVNEKVNRFSKISEVVEEKEEFVKTPTHKIKRFLYNKPKRDKK
ncbi:MAG: AMP-binding protein [Rikenellaceae bacterium]